MATAAATARALILAVLSALLLTAALPAHAQTGTVLYNFTGGSDGGDPGFLLIAMIGVVVKMALRHAFNIKYILVTPWINI